MTGAAVTCWEAPTAGAAQLARRRRDSAARERMFAPPWCVCLHVAREHAEEMGEDVSGWAGRLPSERASERSFFVISGRDILWPLSPISFSEERGDIFKRGV